MKIVGSQKSIADNDTSEEKNTNRRISFINAALRGLLIDGLPTDGGGRMQAEHVNRSNALNQYLCGMISEFFTYDKPKVIQALRYHFITRREIKIMIILVNVFAVASAALFFFRLVSPFAFLISSLLWVVLMVLFWFILPNMIYKKAATFKDTFQAILSNESFRIENERGGRSWDWKEFSTWLESPYFFHLYFNSRAFFIVPKDAFPGDELHEARKILRAKIKK